MKELCLSQKGIIAINTDYCLIAYGNKHGWFIRNGQEFGKFPKISSDLCILYADGTMETVENPKKGVDFDAIYARKPLHVWYFGPSLLDASGKNKTSFNTSLTGKNPRSVLGYYEPGHYCFIAVEGRGDGKGLSTDEMSLLCYRYGMTAAYNMDGGASSAMYFNGNIYGQNGRGTSDIVYIAEPV